MMNSVQLIGRVGQIELKYTTTSTPVLNISLATTETWKDKQGQKQERTEWNRCVVYGKSAETLNQYAGKGSLLYLSGKLQTRQWEKDGENRYTTEIIVKEFRLLDSKKNEASSQSDNSSHHYQGSDEAIEPDYSDDNIPF